jgi:hypothetical protein
LGLQTVSSNILPMLIVFIYKLKDLRDNVDWIKNIARSLYPATATADISANVDSLAQIIF